jgi:glucose/mannose-6-phosphate isomerase
VVDLDDAGAFGGVDRSDALADVEAAAAQWRHARELAGGLRADLGGVTAVLVLGMGGSGISGDVVAAVAADRLDLPVLVHKGYGLPAWVDERTLVLAASYSGGTEETLDGVRAAIGRGGRLVAVTTGGALGELAAEHDFPAVAPPPGRQPRHSLGYLAVPLLVALGLDEGIDEAIDVLAQQEADWDRALPTEAHPLKAIATRLADGTVPVAYGAQGIPALAAARLGYQLNENAKLPALAAPLPELCHNAVVGWEGDSALVGRAGVIWVRDPAGEHERNAIRADLVEGLLTAKTSWQVTLTARGAAPLARLASLLHAVDVLSVYTAIARGVDPTPIPSIDALKAGLAEQPMQPTHRSAR